MCLKDAANYTKTGHSPKTSLSQCCSVPNPLFFLIPDQINWHFNYENQSVALQRSANHRFVTVAMQV